ncbi:MAG: exodeoxyribonuclease VII large subunit [Bacteroidetes bacterium]|nr:exodeoxyribonuclease VII large subunit [Bacteroidota bacterium]
MAADRRIFSLLEVTKSIQKTLLERYTSSFWVKAEMNKLNHYVHSGHCYPELLEKQNNKVIAEMKAVLWRDDFQRINQRFISILKEPLKDGVKILLQARIQFDPVHGLQLWITDIDPEYTLGDLEREKAEAIAQLKIEGIFDRNRELPMPLLPQRLAIISVESSKGYADFRKIIQGNAWGYHFFQMLFPSILQGDQAVTIIIQQLRTIRKIRKHFDAVLIIRGGGGEVGLSCYNNYKLAREIAMFPLPVYTGIGHATNETVVEMVAAFNAITPTKLAEYLLQRFHDFAFPVRDAQELLSDMSIKLLDTAKQEFRSHLRLFKSLVEGLVQSGESEITVLSTAVGQQAKHFLRHHKEELRHQEKNIQLLDPLHTLKRGYSITRVRGKAVQKLSDVNIGDQLVTQVFDGLIESSITQKKES